MASTYHTTEKALRLLRKLPRVSLANIRDNPKSKQPVNIFALSNIPVIEQESFTNIE